MTRTLISCRQITPYIIFIMHVHVQYVPMHETLDRAARLKEWWIRCFKMDERSTAGSGACRARLCWNYVGINCVRAWRIRRCVRPLMDQMGRRADACQQESLCRTLRRLVHCSGWWPGVFGTAMKRPERETPHSVLAVPNATLMQKSRANVATAYY